MINNRKAAIIGTGFVGASTAYALSQKGLYNEIVLIDYNKGKAEGEAMDISHGIPYSSPMEIWSGDYADAKDAGIAIVTAGAAQKPGETRLDLITKNAAIMRGVIRSLVDGGFEGILLIVANPVDVLTHVALKESGFPASRVIGSGTVLDTARYKYLISERLKVDAKNVHGIIIGEHGDSEFPVWSITNIGGIPLNQFAEMRGRFDHEKCMQEIYEQVRDSAYEIIKRKGATYYGVATAVTHICDVICKDRHMMLPVSCELDGQYGLEGLALSVPAIVGREGIEVVLDYPLSEEEKKRLHASAETLKSIIDTL